MAEDADGDDKSDKDDKPKASEITEEDLQELHQGACRDR